MFARRIFGLLNKLEAARRMPFADDWFGVGKHHFQLNPPLSETEIITFEQPHGIVLPDDYRQFLLLVGGGGAGPYYGIEPLSKWDLWFEDEAEESGFLASPCPLVDGPALKQAWVAAQERDARRACGVVSPYAAPNQAWKQFLPGSWCEWGKGTINLCDQGCTYSARLIVSGVARGRVVYFDSQLWCPPYFVNDLNFIDWYERWLDQVLTGSPPTWFGFDPLV